MISAEDAINFGLTGPTRGSGVDYDIRKYEPYGAYRQGRMGSARRQTGRYVRPLLGPDGKCGRRRIIAQCLDQMPEGPIMADVPHVIPPPKAKVMRTWRALIHHFIIFRKGFQAAERRNLLRHWESRKASSGFSSSATAVPRPIGSRFAPLLHSHGRIRPYGARGYLISDIITIFGTYDIVMGECDR